MNNLQRDLRTIMNLPPPPPPPPPDMQNAYPVQLTPPPAPADPCYACGGIVRDRTCTSCGRAVTKAKRINVRNKGQRGERQVVQLLQAIVDKVHRDRNLAPIVLQRNALQAHLGGEDIHGLEGFAVEVKWQEVGYNPAWWRQTLEQCDRRPGWTPILFFRASHQKWQVKIRAYVSTPSDRDQIECDLILSLEDFTEWFGGAYDESVSIKLGECAWSGT